MYICISRDTMNMSLIKALHFSVNAQWTKESVKCSNVKRCMELQSAKSRLWGKYTTQMQFLHSENLQGQGENRLK